ncbi:MAG: GWxTD domain-containing protein [Bacteroidota bacterium]
MSCYNPSKISFTNISYNYINLAKNFNLNVCAYKSDSETCTVYYQFNSQGLFYQKDLKHNYFFSKYKISYELYKSSDLKHIIDSSSFIIVDSIHYYTPSEIFNNFTIRMKDGDSYVLAFTLCELSKKYASTKFINITCQNLLGRNSFQLLDVNNNPIVLNYISKRDKITIVCRDAKIPKLYVSYFNKSFPIAAPPFLVTSNTALPFKPDSVYTIEMNDGKSNQISFNNQGIYHFQTDTTQKEGFTLFRFFDDFPEVTSAEQMLPPLSYITSKAEYTGMSSRKNSKESIDNFWMEKAGNPDRAVELIKSYYNRVQDANRFFTSYTDGWKTDRGMIYIIFGQPLNVYRSATNETWDYGEDRNMLSVTLVFTKTYNPFTDNDYILERSVTYKDMWYNAVEKWRR